ncbi:hypothetical protein ACN38_g11245, partial [Penicillium nordicum]
TLNSLINFTLHHALRRPPRRPLLAGYEPLDALLNYPHHRHPPSALPSTPSSPSTSTSPARSPPQTPTNGVTSIKTNNSNIPKPGAFLV